MPTKSKKSSKKKTTHHEETKKFVVEEKPAEDKVEDVKLVEEKKEEPATPVAPSTPPETTEAEPTTGSTLKIEDSSLPTQSEAPSTSAATSEDKEPLNSEKEKDTLPSSNLSSFSLLDDKKDAGSEKPMTDQDMTTQTQPTVSDAPTTAQPEMTTKSSQDQVNKWIENYDEKEGGEKKKGSGFFKPFLIVLTILSLIAIITGGVFYYQKNIANKDNQSSTNDQTAMTEPTSTPAPTETPTPSETVDYTKYTLQILNGSGVPGEAGSVESMLSKLDFKNIVTGNASSYDYQQTTVSMKADIPAQVFTDISKALGSSYDVATKSETLKDSSSYDVVITVGVKQ